MGYFDKLEDESLATRNLAFVMARANGYKGTIEGLWPLKKSKVQAEKMIMSQELWDTIKKTHNIQ